MAEWMRCGDGTYHRLCGKGKGVAVPAMLTDARGR